MLKLGANASIWLHLLRLPLLLTLMTQIYLLNGPNLNWLGKRDPKIYGSETLAQVEAKVSHRAKAIGLSLIARQSNREGELIDWIQEAMAVRAHGLILNPGAHAHTSYAIRDAMMDAKEAGVPTVEVHISNIYAREPFRHTSVISAEAAAVVNGCGTQGYLFALEFLARQSRPATRKTTGKSASKKSVKKTAKKKTAKKATKKAAKKSARKKSAKKTTRKRR